MNNVIGVNITYNPYGWRNLYVNPKAGHLYAKKYPGHESLNFHFDKTGIDDKNFVYGFVQWRYPPKSFANGGIVLFYTRNYLKNVGEIVGIYGNASILKPVEYDYKGFQKNKLTANIKAQKDLSILFPIPLESNKYKKGRFIGQVGFSYFDKDIVIKIILDEMRSLKKTGLQIDELNKLANIYQLLTGTKLDIKNNDDIKQQMELENIYSAKALDDIIEGLKNAKSSDPEKIVVKSKTYKRDNYIIALLKIYRKFKCQICGTSIKKKDKKNYVEAAHITTKKDKGTETPDNILILCPNHHKEFDLGLVNVKKRTKNLIQFDMNGTLHKIDLTIK